jgi:DeoR/GlpR family transcriptional regulator of sugar metabolism
MRSYGQVEPSERHLLIVDRLRQTEHASVTELAQAVRTSEVTIRRDLELLADRGMLRRVRGGAVGLLSRGEEPPFAFRELEATDAKKRIGAAVAALISDGEAVVLDSGTTGLEVARSLAGRRVTVMPLCLQSAGALTEPPTKLVLPGGELRPGELSVTGPLAEAGLRALRFDIAVLTCCGVSAEHGVTAHNLGDAAVKSTAIASARRVVLAADATKFARTAMAAVAPLTRVDLLVTDAAAPERILDAVRTLGIEVLLV